MKIAYVDTSFLLAVVFSESGYHRHLERLEGFDHLCSSTLLEAEMMAAARRESKDPKDLVDILSKIDWIFPRERLSKYFIKIYDQGYLRGADAFHLATALWLANSLASKIHFLSLDKEQAKAAKKLEFNV